MSLMKPVLQLVKLVVMKLLVMEKQDVNFLVVYVLELLLIKPAQMMIVLVAEIDIIVKVYKNVNGIGKLIYVLFMRQILFIFQVFILNQKIFPGILNSKIG